MNWLARLKNRTGIEADATKTTESLFVVSVAHPTIPFEKSRLDSISLPFSIENVEITVAATPRVDLIVDRGLTADDAQKLLEGLNQFCFDDVQADIDAGHSASDLIRVNNMAWEFMQADGIGFDEAIKMAAEIVAGTKIAVCEAGYVDVFALFTKMCAERDNHAKG